MSVLVILSRVPVTTGRLDKKTSSFTKSARCNVIRLLMITFNSSNNLLIVLAYNSFSIYTSGLPARDIFAWILRYQLKITNTDESLTNMRVFGHDWLLNDTKKYWSTVNFMSKHSHISAIFDNTF